MAIPGILMQVLNGSASVSVAKNQILDCDDRCSGDSHQNCGGTNAISIWKTPPKYLHGECFYDFPSPRRVFENGYSIDGLEDLTIGKCIEICRHAGVAISNIV